MQTVHAIGLHQLRQSNALFDLAVSVILLHIMVGSVLDQNREILSAGLFADLDQFFQKTGPLFQCTAVFVSPGVPGRVRNWSVR
jgi:hypothetical protein